MRVARMGCAASFGPQWHGAAMRRISVWAVGLLWLCATPCATAPTEAAVALLADVRNPTTTEAMLRNLATLARTCAWARRYDVIVFHEGRSDALRPRLEALGNRTRLRSGKGISWTSSARRRDTTGRHALGPWHRLQTYAVGSPASSADVRPTYLLRLDTDSSPVPPARATPSSSQPGSALYGYVAVKTDHPMVAKICQLLAPLTRGACRRSRTPSTASRRMLPQTARRPCSTRTSKS